MQLFGKDLGTDVVVVAEVGVNHEGDVNKAEELLRLAAGAGADAVKFQSYTAERFICASDAERLARVRRFGLDEAAHERLAAAAREVGVVFFSTAVSEDVMPLLDRLCPAIKIASGDLDFEPVIRAAARTGKPVILSTGAGNVDEVDQAVEWVRAEVGGDALGQRLVLMHCVSSYPTPVEQANVLSVPFLRERYGLEVGYSNHVIGIEACLAAVAHGASVVEAHFTDCKTGRDFRDHELSIEPSDLAQLVSMAPRVRASLGSRDKRLQPCEAEIGPVIRKGVVAARDLSVGTVLTADDLMYARPATEFPAAQFNALLGRRLSADVGRGVPLPRSALARD